MFSIPVEEEGEEEEKSGGCTAPAGQCEQI